jgi:hypothetical protein
MREPLKLAEQTILAALQTHFPISISALTFLPIGPDSDSTAYCVQADNGGVYFLKIRAGKGFSPPSLFCFDPQTPPPTRRLTSASSLVPGRQTSF